MLAALTTPGRTNGDRPHRPGHAPGCKDARVRGPRPGTRRCAARPGPDSRETTALRIRPQDSPTRGLRRTADRGYRAAVDHRQRALAPGARALRGTLPTRAGCLRAHSGYAGVGPNCLAVGPGPGVAPPDHGR